MSASGVTLICPRCDLTLVARLPLLAPRHCPRCLARRRVAVKLDASGCVSATEISASVAAPVSRTAAPVSRTTSRTAQRKAA